MYDDIPILIERFLKYSRNIQNRSEKTIKEYYYDLRNSFRFIKAKKENLDTTDLTIINISNIDIEFIKKITLDDLYNYLDYLTLKLNDKPITRSRKVSALKSFFKYLCFKEKALDINPTIELETPKIGTRQPKYLTLDESELLLHSIDGKFVKRDYAIMTIFLNCGLRLSELVGINLANIKDDILTVNGKGNKERNIYLNSACKKAIQQYLLVRPVDTTKDKNALFISNQGTRISGRMVELIVKKYITLAGLDPKKYTPHKLRHTAATLMHKYGGVDIRALQQILGHETIATTEIYTHIDSEQVRQALESNPLNNIKNN
ncbi:MAG: tyrosine recombinase XerC [Clostridia bacterium]